MPTLVGILMAVSRAANTPNRTLVTGRVHPKTHFQLENSVRSTRGGRKAPLCPTSQEQGCPASPPRSPGAARHRQEQAEKGKRGQTSIQKVPPCQPPLLLEAVKIHIRRLKSLPSPSPCVNPGVYCWCFCFLPAHPPSCDSVPKQWVN